MATEVYAIYGRYGKNGRAKVAYTEGEVWEYDGVRYGVTNYEPIGNDEIQKIGYWKVSELSTGLLVCIGPTKVAAKSNAMALHSKVKKKLGLT